MAQKPVIGIDLGGTNMQVGVVAESGKVLGTSRKKTKAADGMDAVLSRLSEGVIEACAEAKLSLKDIAAVGIGAPGAPMPTAAMLSRAIFASTHASFTPSARRASTASMPSAALVFLRAVPSTFPPSPTTPICMLVPPRSMPITGFCAMVPPCRPA